MPVGFESIGDSGNFQVDSSFKNLAMVRSGTVASQQYSNGSTQNTNPSRVGVTLYEGEILAVSCSEYCSLGGKVGDTAYVYVSAPAGQPVNYYIFKPGGLTVSSFGLQVWNEVGELTFDSGWSLFDVRAILSGYNSVSLVVGRKYAFVQCQIGARVDYTRVHNGVPPNSFISDVRVTYYSSVRVVNQTVQCEQSAIDIGATPPRPGPGPGSYDTRSNGVNPISLIIDVTGF